MFITSCCKLRVPFFRISEISANHITTDTRHKNMHQCYADLKLLFCLHIRLFAHPIQLLPLLFVCFNFCNLTADGASAWFRPHTALNASNVFSFPNSTVRGCCSLSAAGRVHLNPRRSFCSPLYLLPCIITWRANAAMLHSWSSRRSIKPGSVIRLTYDTDMLPLALPFKADIHKSILSV